jgi:hypothetical protein
VFKSPKFDKKIKKMFSNKDLNELDIFIENLKKSKIKGKPLSYNYFREKRIKEKRVYFLIYENLKIVLIVNVSNKKYQQETINEIKLLMGEFKKYAQDLYDKLNKK